MNDDSKYHQEEEDGARSNLNSNNVNNNNVNHHQRQRQRLDQFLENEQTAQTEEAEVTVNMNMNMNMNMAAYWQQRFDDESAHSHNTSLSGSFSHARRRTSASAALSTCRQEDEDEEAVSTSTSFEPANVSLTGSSSGLGRSKSYNHQEHEEHEELQKEQRQELRANRNRLRATQSFDAQQARQSVASSSSYITGNCDCAADSSTRRADSRWATGSASISTTTTPNSTTKKRAVGVGAANANICSPPSTPPFSSSPAKDEEARIRRNLVAQSQCCNISNRSSNSKEEEARLRRKLLARSALHNCGEGSSTRPNSTRKLQEQSSPSFSTGNSRRRTDASPITSPSASAANAASPQQEYDQYQLKVQEGLDRIRQVQQQLKALDNENSINAEDFTNRNNNSARSSSPPCSYCQAPAEGFCRAHAHLQHCPGAYSVNGIVGGSLHRNTITSSHTRSLSPLPPYNYSSTTTPSNHSNHNNNHADERSTTPNTINPHHHQHHHRHPTQQHPHHQHQHHPFDPLPLLPRQRRLFEGVLAIAAVVVDDRNERDLEQERELLAQKQQELAEREARLAEQAARLQAWVLELERRQQQASQMQMPPVVHAAEVHVMEDGSSEQEDLERELEDDEESPTHRPGAPARSWSFFSSKSRSSQQQQRRRPPRRRQSSLGYYHSNSSIMHSSPSGHSSRQQRRGSLNQSMSTFGNSSISSFGFSSIGIGISMDSFVGDDATSITPPSFTRNTSGGGISRCHESRDSLGLWVIETADVTPVSRAIVETAELATVSRPTINSNADNYHCHGHDSHDSLNVGHQYHNPEPVLERSSPPMMPPLPRTITASTRCILAIDGNNTVELAGLAQAELGEGPLRFAPNPEEELSLEEQVAILSSRDRHVLRIIQQRWNDRHDKLLAKHGSGHKESLPELSIQWHLRFCYLYAKQEKHFNPDGSHYYKSRFSEDRTWAAEKKLQKRFVGLNVSSLTEQLQTKTLFPVPGLKTSDGLNMFYMRPARYFPNQTSVRTIIDNQCYVMNTMLENNPLAHSQGIGFIACMDNWKMKNFEVNYCYQFMMGLQGFMVPVKTRLFLIVNPPSWFGAIWKIMKPMLLPSFRRLVKIVPESKIFKYLQPGYEQYLPDDMQTGLADTDAMVQDFISYRQFIERDQWLGSDAHDSNHDDGSNHSKSDTMWHQGMDENRSISSRYCGSDPIHDSNHSDSGSSLGDPDCEADDDDDNDDDASIHCDISDEEALEEEDMKQPASPSDRMGGTSDDRLEIPV